MKIQQGNLKRAGWTASPAAHWQAAVFAGGVTEPGAIAGHPALEPARAMGAAIA